MNVLQLLLLPAIQRIWLQVAAERFLPAVAMPTFLYLVVVFATLTVTWLVGSL